MYDFENWRCWLRFPFRSLTWKLSNLLYDKDADDACFFGIKIINFDVFLSILRIGHSWLNFAFWYLTWDYQTYFGKLIHLITFFTLNDTDAGRTCLLGVKKINFDVFWSFMRIGHSFFICCYIDFNVFPNNKNIMFSQTIKT